MPADGHAGDGVAVCDRLPCDAAAHCRSRRPSAPDAGSAGASLRGAVPPTVPRCRQDGAGGAARPTIPTAPRVCRRRGRHKVIQLYDAYLVMETEEGMLVIDQHALHERILFEQLKRRLQSGSLETQRLLIPEPVELTAEQAARTLEQRDALAELGLGVEDFGGGTVLLTSYPALLGRRSPQAILRAVVDHLTLEGPAADARSAVQRSAEPDGLSRGGAGRRPADAGADGGPGGAARTWPTTRITARTAGRRRCCSAGTTSTGNSVESEWNHRGTETQRRQEEWFPKPSRLPTNGFCLLCVSVPLWFHSGWPFQNRRNQFQSAAVARSRMALARMLRMAQALASPSLPGVRLEVRSAGGRPIVYEVGDGGFLIGGVPGCDLRLPGGNVAPVVCLIARHARGASLRKLAPVQPIAVNGRNVSSTYLNNGDRITLGPVEVAVSFAAGAPSSPEGEADPAARQRLQEITAREAELQARAEEQEKERILWFRRRDEIEAECRRHAEAAEATSRRLHEKEAELERREQAWRSGEEELDRQRQEWLPRVEDAEKQFKEAKGLRRQLAQIREKIYERYRNRRDRLNEKQKALRGAAKHSRITRLSLTRRP